MKSPPVMSGVYCQLFVYDPIEDANNMKMSDEQECQMKQGDRVRFIGTALVGEGGTISNIDADHALVEVYPTIAAVKTLSTAGQRIMTAKVPLSLLRLDPQ